MKMLLTLLFVVASVLCADLSATASTRTTSSLLAARVQDAQIKGNKNSMIYHLPGCASYNQISPRNVVWFRTEAEARAAGYRKARNC